MTCRHSLVVQDTYASRLSIAVDPGLVEDLRTLSRVLREPNDRVRPERIVRENAFAGVHVEVTTDSGSEPFQRGRQDRNQVYSVG